MTLQPQDAEAGNGLSGDGKLIGILLAAGFSTRFGGSKCLARMANGVAMAVQAARNLESAVDHVVCVVRTDDIVLKSEITAAGFDVVECADSAKGMSASLRSGVRATPEADGWLIALADMPWIRPSTCRMVARELKQKGGIVVPVFKGEQGHPVGFPASRIGDLQSLSGDHGARALLDRYPREVRRIVTEDPGILRDVDTPEQLRCAS